MHSSPGRDKSGSHRETVRSSSSRRCANAEEVEGLRFTQTGALSVHSRAAYASSVPEIAKSLSFVAGISDYGHYGVEARVNCT